MGQGNTKSYKFALKHVFKNVSTMAENSYDFGATEEYFSVPWYICIKREKDSLAVYLQCDRSKNKKEWSIDTEFEICVLHPNGKSICKTQSSCYQTAKGWGWGEFMSWETMEKEYLVNDELIVKIRVKRMYTTGIYKANLRNFNDEKCSDVTLVVNDKKFHVAKLYLSSHSSSFRLKFSGGPGESKNPEIQLDDVDADDLQKYLEALYGEDAIDGNYVY